MGPERHGSLGAPGAAAEPTTMRRRVFAISLCAAAGLVLGLAALAGAGLGPNQANHKRLIDRPIEDLRYDPGERCRKRTMPGARRLVRWLARRTSGANWGTYRCERWGKKRASVHSEGRAVDWNLDARRGRERRQANRLIRKRLLATDRRGNEFALARRMGIQGIIYNCRSWYGGRGMGPYSYCYRKNGKRKPKRKLDPTQAHIDHIHIELNVPGGRAKTSFWRSGLR